MSARPVLDKIVNTMPLYVYYRPHGVSLGKLEEIILTLEEIEALNLKDRQGLDQKKGSVEMGISRSTFQRLLKSARKKVAAAIVEGKALKFEGGNYIPDKNIIRTRCIRGTYHYRIKREDIREKSQEYRLSKIKCPECGKRLVMFE